MSDPVSGSTATGQPSFRRKKPIIDLSTDPRSRELRQTPLDYKEVFRGKAASTGTDPCELASRASLACLETNSYNRSACKIFFEDLYVTFV